MRRSLLPCLLLLLLAACPKPQLDFGPDGEVKDPQVLLRQLAVRSIQVLGLKGEAKVKVKTPKQSGSVGEFVACLRPASLHLETLNFFGKPVGVLATDGEKFALYAEENASFYTGPASAENVSRLLPIVLEPAEVVMLLLGDVPILPTPEIRLEVDVPRRAYLLTLKRGPITQRLWLATRDFLPLHSEIRGAPAYDLTLEDYQEVNGVRFPRSIGIVTVDEKGEPAGTEITVKYKELELNPEVDLSLFTLEKPPSARLIEVDARGFEKGSQTPAPKEALPLQPEPKQP